MSRSRAARSVEVQVRPGDRWISRIAGALSYTHMRQLAQDHGQSGWHAHAFPLSVDGIEIVAASSPDGQPSPCSLLSTFVWPPRSH
jgi:hypothetical protein